MSKEQGNSRAEGRTAGSKIEDSKAGSSNPLYMLLVPDPEVYRETKTLLANKKTSVDILAACIAKDPALVVEILKICNSVKMSSGKTQTTSISNGIIALGMQQLAELVDSVSQREKIADCEVADLYAQQRKKCVDNGTLARVIAEIAGKQVASSAYTAGLMLYLGEMIAVAHLGQRFVALSKKEDGVRSKILYRLNQDLNFNTEEVGIKFLKQNGIPEKIVSAIDRPATSQSEEGLLIKAICLSAGEMLEASDNGKLDRYAPGIKLPPKSAVRMLRLNDQSYEKLFGLVSTFFNSGEIVGLEPIVEEIKEDFPPTATLISGTESATLPLSSKDSDFQEEAESGDWEGQPDDQIYKSEELESSGEGEVEGKIEPFCLDGALDSEEDSADESAGDKNSSEPRLREDFSSASAMPAPTIVSPRSPAVSEKINPPISAPYVPGQKKDRLEEMFGETLKSFGIKTKPVEPPKAEPVPAPVAASFLSKEEHEEQDAAPAELVFAGPSTLQSLSCRVDDLLYEFSHAMEDLESGKELIEMLLDSVIEEGVFERTAIFEVAEDLKSAELAFARGSFINEGQIIPIDGDNHPLAHCIYTVQCVPGSQPERSPLGSKAFAMAPIDFKSKKKLVLYVDSGLEKAIPLAARRMFRELLKILNDKLPELGGV